MGQFCWSCCLNVTAKALGLDNLPTMFALAHEVIERESDSSLIVLRVPHFNLLV